MMTHEEMTMFLRLQFGLSEENADSLAHCLETLRDCPPDDKSSFELNYIHDHCGYGSMIFWPGKQAQDENH